MKKLVLFLLFAIVSNYINAQTEEDSRHVIIGYGDSKELVFENDSDLREWASLSEDRKIFIEKLEMIEEKQNFAKEQGYLDDLEATDRYVESIINPKSGGKRAFKEVLPSYMILNAIFDNTGYSGSFIPFSVLMPSLLHLNDKGSSIAVIMGGTVLCDRTWFRGPKLWIFGLPGVIIPDLSSPVYNFNNKAASSFGF